MPAIQIARVHGHLDANGDLERIEVHGTADGVQQAVLQIRCAGDVFSTSVNVTDNQFSVTLDREQARAFECVCEEPIEVRVSSQVDEGIGDRWKGELKCVEDGDETPQTGNACKGSAEALVTCDAPSASDGPQHVLPFTQVIPFEKLPLADQIDVHRPNPQVGKLVVPTNSVNLHLAALLHFEQRWFFQRHLLSDLVATIALAPHESLRLAIRKTQRKRLTQRTLESVEEMDLRESSLIDKDVLNVARSMSTTENWSVNGNGSFSIGGLSIGASGSYAKTVNRATQSSVQRLREATRKSANSLKTLQKTEIEEVSEQTDENLTSRSVINPYHDRTLLVRAYDQIKNYCTETELISVRPALLVTAIELPFDRAFILRYGDFLAEALLDTALKIELGQALEAATELRYDLHVQRAVEISQLALQYLFEEPPRIFNARLISPFAGGGPDPNNPAHSFDAQLNRSGLSDAVRNDLGVVFTTLAYYYRIYQERVAPQANPPAETLLQDRFAMDLVVSMEKYLTPLWQSVEDQGKISNVLDQNDQNEVLRRLSGFLSLVSGTVTPIAQPLEEQRGHEASIRKAEQVIDRAVHHIKENSAYYTRRFFEYLQGTSRQEVLRQFVSQVVAASNVNQPDALIDRLDTDSAYLDGAKLVVPAHFDQSEKDFEDFSAFLRESADDEPMSIGQVTIAEVDVPCEGVHFEVTPGRCVLEDLPERSIVVLEKAGVPESGSTDVAIQSEE